MRHDEPHRRVLDREIGGSTNEEFFRLVDDVLSEAVNRSTYTFARCWETVPETIQGQMPLLLFRHCLEMADAVHVLVMESASAPARLQLRSLYEGVLFLEYMLEADTQLRVTTYIASSYLWGLRSARRMQRGSPERRQFVKELQSGPLADPTLVGRLMTTKEDVAKYENALQSPDLAAGYASLRAYKQKHGRWPAAWYIAVDETLHSLRDLAIHLGRGVEYVRYDLWSRSVHPDLLAVHMIRNPTSTEQRVRKLRDGDRITDAVVVCVDLLRDANVLALRHARPAESASFSTGWQRDLAPLTAQFGEEITVWGSEDETD